MQDEYRTLNVKRSGAVLDVQIDNPPMNLIDLWMLDDLDRLGRSLLSDELTKVVVFRSAIQNFFIAHADLKMFVEAPAAAAPQIQSSPNEILNRFAELPQISIGLLQGRAIGGGAEFLLALDMVFAEQETAVMGLFEVAIGSIPGAGGTQRLPRRIGNARALEAIVGCDEFDALTLERYGWVNRSLPAIQIDEFVGKLADRIASFPGETIAAAKRAVSASHLPLSEGLKKEQEAQAENSTALSGQPSRMVRFLELGGQNPEFEKSRMRLALETLG